MGGYRRRKDAQSLHYVMYFYFYPEAFHRGISRSLERLVKLVLSMLCTNMSAAIRRSGDRVHYLQYIIFVINFSGIRHCT